MGPKKLLKTRAVALSSYVMAVRGLALALVLPVLLCSSAFAGPPTERLEGLFAATSRILADAATADRPFDRLRAILALVDDAFDFRGAAELALGREWHARTAAERREFVELFADLLERAFVFGLATRIDPSSGVRVRYLDESLVGPRATVATAVATRDGGESRLDYRMIERRGRWLVQDVVVDGVSVIANYRSQFQRVVHSSSYEELVSQMRARLSEGLIASQIAAGGRRPRLAWAEETPPAPERADAPPTPVVVPVSAPPAPVIAAARARAIGTSYWVQVGAFRSAEAARRLAARLGQSAVTLAEGRRAGETPGLMHVRVGPFADRREAVAKLLELKGRGYQPFILERRG